MIKKSPRLALALSLTRANGKQSTGPQRSVLANSLLGLLKGLKAVSFMAVCELSSRWVGKRIEVPSPRTYIRSLHNVALKVERY